MSARSQVACCRKPLIWWSCLIAVCAGSSVLGQSISIYNEAETLIRAGQWSEGIDKLTPLLRNSPNNAKLLNLLGIAYAAGGNNSKATEAWHHAVTADPNFYPALKNLALNEVAEKDYKAARTHLSSVLKFAPADPVANAYLAEAEWQEKRWLDACRHYESGIQVTLQRPKLTLHFAESLLKTGEKGKAISVLQTAQADGMAQFSFAAGLLLARHNLFSDAVPFFDSARTLNPGSTDAVFNLALCLVETKRNTEAIAILEPLRNSNGKASDIFNLLAQAYEAAGRTQDALDSLRQATLADPHEEQSYLDLAAICLNHDSYEVGVETVNVGLRYLPDSGRLRFQRAVLNAMLGRFEDAEQDLQRSAALSPSNDTAYVALGLVYIQKSDLPKAIQVLRQRVRERPKQYGPLSFLGEALIRSGAMPGSPEFAEAKRSLEQSIHLNDEFYRSRLNLARLLLAEHKPDLAIEHLEKARKLAVADKAIYAQLAIAYRQTGHYEQVKQMLAIVRRLNNEERQGTSHLARIVRTGESS